MKLKTKFIYTILALLICFGIYLYLDNIGSSQIHYLFPRSNDSNLSVEYRNAQKSVGFYREQIKKNPNNPKYYAELAQIFFQEARITGKYHEYLPKITGLLETALSIDKENLEANLTKAAVLLNQHQFNEVEKIGEWINKKYPRSSAAFGILVDAYVELGKYNKAVEMCDKMIQARPDFRSYSRASYIREIYGDISGAIEAMRMAADAGVYGEENRAWALCNLANLYLHAGKIDTAAFIYNGILEERPGYAFALSGLAKVMVNKGDNLKAAEYLKKAVQNLDEHTFSEQLSDIYMKLGKKLDEEKYIQIVLNEFKEHEKAGWNIDREYAQFCLNHDINKKESLFRAQREYRRRQTNIDVIDTYAWALYKNRKVKKAAVIIKKAFATNTENPLIYYHSGVINSESGNKAEAVKNLEHALKGNLASYVLFYKDAKDRLLRLKDIASIN